MALIGLRATRRLDLPLALTGLSALIAAAMVLPAAYLVLRVIGAGGAAWETVTTSSSFAALLRTTFLALVVTGGTIAIALPAAWLTTRTDLPLRGLWSVLLALPLVFPSYVAAFTFVAALGPRGMLQDMLEPLGVGRLPEIYGFKGTWLALTLFTFPYVLLPVRAALRSMDRSLEEASRGLGKSGLLTFFRVTLPQLRPSIAAGALLVSLYTLSDFGAVSIFRFDSLTRVIFLQYTSAFDRSSAAALALLLVGLALFVVALEGVTRGRSRYYTTSKHQAPSLVRLGHWRWPALAFCTVIAAFSLALPISVIAFWLVKGVAGGASFGLVREAGFNSLYASGLAALAAIGAALPVAILSARRPGFLSGLLEKLTYSGFALPGITIALALVFFAANYATPIYQTLGLLLFAYVVRFLPQAVGSCRSALLQVNPNTEQAARGLGRNGMQVLARVTVPQVLPGMSAGAVLVFLTAMKELPATLLLSPIGFETLATQIWHSTTEGFFARAAVPALILVAVSSLPMIVMVLRERSR